MEVSFVTVTRNREVKIRMLKFYEGNICNMTVENTDKLLGREHKEDELATNTISQVRPGGVSSILGICYI